MPLRLLLCTDMDRTLLPNGVQPESRQARPLFRALAAQAGVTIAYVTGRHRALVEQAIDEYALPLPDYVIADVGSTIYRIEHGRWSRWPHWEEAIAADWNGCSRADLAALFADIDSLRLQEDEKQNTHKLSYYASTAVDVEHLLTEMQSRLADRAVTANLIWSIDEKEQKGLLDVLPASASKRHAIEFMVQSLAYRDAEVVFSGDSGNDLAVLASPLRAVVVANATDELKAEALRQSRQAGTEDRLYIARGDFLGMNGNYSAGILEGVAHYLPDFVSFLSANQRKLDGYEQRT